MDVDRHPFHGTLHFFSGRLAFRSGGKALYETEKSNGEGRGLQEALRAQKRIDRRRQQEPPKPIQQCAK